ncbi:hypothetical protein IFM89_002705 [Coptis chinensis]|uniref:Cytochrome b5 heme-binding domain-containing protein n=1 Tax=Coptis chinensis TaxID=261450 RepID=A0A835ILT2_9MAGN|nr:hypothetical protein IFM89_002705 [Coptis chinensis]
MLIFSSLELSLQKVPRSIRVKYIGDSHNPYLEDVLGIAVAFYYLVSGLFAAPTPPPRQRSYEAEMEPLVPPVQLGEVTEEELKVYDGLDSKKPLLIAIKGQIYDVTQSRTEISFEVGGGGTMYYLVEELIHITENLNFDYTKSVISIIMSCPSVSCGLNCKENIELEKYVASRVIAPNQNLNLVISLKLPESDYNQKLGVFQFRYLAAFHHVGNNFPWKDCKGPFSKLWFFDP